jgi:hypothetical protein
MISYSMNDVEIFKERDLVGKGDDVFLIMPL